MTDILVQKDGTTYTVTVKDETSTTHSVTMSDEDYQRISQGKCSPEELVKKSFEFLLEREPKESILSSFNITLISKYFPEYEEEIAKQV